jgi:hypothetical protein
MRLASHQLLARIRSHFSAAVLGKRHHQLVDYHVKLTVIVMKVIAALVTHHAQKLKPSSVELLLTTLLQNAVTRVLQEQMMNAKMERSVSSIHHVEIFILVMTKTVKIHLMKIHCSVVLILLTHPPGAIFPVHRDQHLNALLVRHATLHLVVEVTHFSVAHHGMTQPVTAKLPALPVSTTIVLKIPSVLDILPAPTRTHITVVLTFTTLLRVV